MKKRASTPKTTTVSITSDELIDLLVAVEQHATYWGRESEWVSPDDLRTRQAEAEALRAIIKRIRPADIIKIKDT